MKIIDTPERYFDGTIDLRCGDWREVLADVEECDVLLSDPPYSCRTAAGYKTNPDWSKEIGNQKGIEYGSIDQQWASGFVSSWWPRTRHWAIIFGDHISSGWFRELLAAEPSYVFAPVIWVRTDAAPRFVGDGPTSSVDYMTIARRKSTVANGSPRRGSRPGHYFASSRHGIVSGGKDPVAMQKLICDYTLPGDLVVDPCAGGATTLITAAIEGRRAIGAEIDPETFAKAVLRIKKGYTVSMFGGQVVEMKQEALL